MLEHLRLLKKTFDFNALCSGAVESEYQKQRIDFIANELRVPSFCPLWKRFSLLNAYNDMDIVIVKVSAYGLSKDDLGKRFSEIKEKIKKYHLHPFLEGGEAETAVLDAPFFYKKIVIKEKAIKWHGDWGELIIKKAGLIKK